MSMTTEAVQAQVELFLGEIKEALADDLQDVEFIIAESREAAVIRLNALLDPSEQDVIKVEEIPVQAKGIWFGDSAEVVEAQENDGELSETIEYANGAIVLIVPNLLDTDEVDIVLLHEIGHALGLDEDEVEALGLGFDSEVVTESPPTDAPKPPETVVSTEPA